MVKFLLVKELGKNIFVDVSVGVDGSIWYLGKLKSASDNGHGYKTICITKTLGGVKFQRRFYVHRLVAEAFLEGFLPGLEVNHRDFNRGNNRLNNLEMCTRKENLAYSSHRRKRCCTYSEYLKILELHYVGKMPVFEIVNFTNVSRSGIRKILIGTNLLYKNRYLDQGNMYNIAKFEILYWGRNYGM
jgi:hypothetical protein